MHTCPECGQACCCNGDIDDIILDTEEAYLNCCHCDPDEIEDDDDDYYCPECGDLYRYCTCRFKE